MTSQQTIIERAYVLATDCRSRDMVELHKRLRTEGFTHAELTQLQFPLIARSLRRVMRNSGAEATGSGCNEDGDRHDGLHLPERDRRSLPRRPTSPSEVIAEQRQTSSVDDNPGLVIGGQGGCEKELLEDGQEEVFSRTEVEIGRIEHKAEAGSGEEARAPFGRPVP